MRRVILDASALLTWFAADGAGGRLRSEYENGLLGVVAPHTLITDMLAELAATRNVPADRLVRIAAEVDRLGFEFREPPLDEVAAWLARDIDRQHASYAALASALDLPLITADPDLLRRASSVARSITDG
ncbi:MAG: hypothetical protein M3406_18255 [Chloroflexota bacterium]|nr:hypothetical protein [Chloroflexota bacterium]